MAWGGAAVFPRLASNFLLVGALAFLAVLFLVAPEQLRTARGAGPMALAAMAAISHLLLSRGKVKAASLVLILGAWTYITLISVFVGGLHSNSIFIYPVIIIRRQPAHAGRRGPRQGSAPVGVVSESGRGSCFWLTARLRRAAAGPQADDSPPGDTSRELLARHFAGVPVLVVEDESVSREVAAFLLGDAGLAVSVAENGAEAVTRARENAYALILMDVQMPIMNGLDATRAIRALPGMSAIPILAMTANAFAQDRSRCLEAGMDELIGKPVSPDALYATLWHWLSKSAAVAAEERPAPFLVAK